MIIRIRLQEFLKLAYWIIEFVRIANFLRNILHTFLISSEMYLISSQMAFVISLKCASSDLYQVDFLVNLFFIYIKSM